MELMKMRTIWFISLFCIMFLLILTSCNNNVNPGMNEISLNNLAKKIGEEKSFLLVTFAADEEDVEESELVEAFEEVLANKDKVALFVNLGEDAKDEEVLNQLKIEGSPSESSEEAWQPTKDGFVLIHEGEMVKKSSTTSLEKPSIKA